MKHFWFIGWPDHKAPPATAEQLLELVHNVETYRALHRIKYPTKSGAVAVHCRYFILLIE
jgi:protein tyrosine phosphatase